MSNRKANRVDVYPVPDACPYCGGEVKYLSNSFIYGREYGNGKCYACLSCRAFVGVHTGTQVPLGRLADKQTTTLRKQCHALFDPMWRDKKVFENRKQAYSWLADQLGIPVKECHMAWLTDVQLVDALAHLKRKKLGGV